MSKPISISLTASKPLAASQQPLSKKRPAANLDSDSDDDDNDHREKVHVITAFDAARGGAVGERPEGGEEEEEEEEEKGPLVITSMKNRDWRAEAERRKGGKGSVWLPPEAFAGHAEGEEAMEVDTGAGVQYGLQVFERRTEDGLPLTPPPPPPPGEGEKGEKETVEAKTEEEQALAALLSNSSNPPSTTLILPSAADTDWRDRDRDEQQAYKTDLASRPDVPTLDDYAAVPVEEFGAALLRGMGWREGMELGKRGGRAKQSKLLNVEKRPAFLGIGAKAKEEVPELGTWGKADKTGRKRGGNKRVDTTYVPVVLVDKKTGRVVDESTATENGKSTNGGSSADRDRWDRKDQERAHHDDDSDRRRRRDRSRDHRDSRHHHYHHHRDRDRDRDHHSDRHRDRERGERSHKSRDERDSRRRSRDRYERRDRR